MKIPFWLVGRLVVSSGVCLMALSLSGCGADAADSGMATTRDTLPNGATLVRHTPPPGGVPVTWGLQEDLRIGTMDGGGPDQFGRIGGLAVAEDGRIVVLDAQAQEIRVFGSDGEHLRTFGGKGGGPGELETANGILMGPDGLLRVPDARNTRLSYFDLEDGFVRSHRYEPMYLSWSFQGVLGDDGTLWSVHYLPSETPGQRGRLAYVGQDSTGTPVDTLPHPDAGGDPDNDPGAWSIRRDGRMMASIGVPFYPHRQHFLDSRLRLWSTVDGDPSYRVERTTAEGEPDLVIEMGRPLQPVDRAAADSIVTHWEGEFDTKLDRSKVPEMAPAIGSLFQDDDGRLWVVANTAHADSIRTLDAYDSDGRWLGTLATQTSIAPFPHPVIRGDTLWAVARDELDVPYVVRGRLIMKE